MNVKNLLETLKKLPADLQLVPVNGEKKPLGYEWQHNTLTPEEMHSALQLGGIRVKGKKGQRITVWLPKEGNAPRDDEIGGFGVLTGTPIAVEGKKFLLMAIDCDGKSAMEGVKVLSQKSKIPRTVAFSSGRPSRCQYLFLVPEELAESVKTRRLTTDREKNEQIEFRWKGMISALPPSVHPETGKYRWRRRIDKTAIAIAPDWVIEVMQGKLSLNVSKSEKSRKKLSIARSERTKELTNRANWTKRPRLEKGSEIEKAISLLQNIPAELADGYWEWIKVGTALKTVSEKLLPEWEQWSQQSTKYKPGECEQKWKFLVPGAVTIGTLYYLANQGG